MFLFVYWFPVRRGVFVFALRLCFDFLRCSRHFDGMLWVYGVRFSTFLLSLMMATGSFVKYLSTSTVHTCLHMHSSLVILTHAFVNFWMESLLYDCTIIAL